MGYFLPQRWRQQPQGPVTVDWSNPLSVGLVDVLLPALLRTTIKGVAASPGSSLTTRPGINGRARVTPTNAATRDAYSGMGQSLSAPMSHFIFHRQLDTSSTRLVGTFVLNTSGFGFIPNTSHRAVACQPANSIITGSTVVAGKLKADLHTIGTASHQLYENGIQTASATLTGYTSGAVAYGIGADTAAVVASAAEIYLSAIWSRQLNQTEAWALYENPWQIFKPLTPRLWFLAPTTSATVVPVFVHSHKQQGIM